MKEFLQQHYVGERALYHLDDAKISDCSFADGESPLKEGSDLFVENCVFHWRYPIWYCRQVKVEDTTFLAGTRAGMWYCNDLAIRNCVAKSPKNLRRCTGLTVSDSSFTDGNETLWHCKDVKLKNVCVRGDYFAMNSENMEIDGLILDGQYAFDGVKNVVMRNSRLATKDCFWNSENVTVYDSHIIGEYLAWNTKNITFVNCTIESDQGLCYMENVKLINCKLIHTDLCFEYVSDIDAEIVSTVESIKNPISGRIVCKKVGELILDPDLVDPKATEIIETEKE